MKKRTPSGRDPKNITGGGDRYEALLEVLEHTAAQEARDRKLEAESRRRKPDDRVPPWFAIVLLVVTLWLWLFPPGVLRVQEPPPQPIEQEEAAVRFAIYLQAQRIKAHRLATNQYPQSLDEVGASLDQMEYVLLSPDLYQLTAWSDRVRLTYRSDLPLRDFVGSADRVVEEAGS